MDRSGIGPYILERALQPRASNLRHGAKRSSIRAEAPIMSHATAIPSSFPENTIFIAGAGRFGRRAARVLTSTLKSPVWLIDRDEKVFLSTGEVTVSRILMDAAQFLEKHFELLKPGHTIVPAVPTHLAFDWLARHADGKIVLEDIPQELKNSVPNPWPGPEGSLLVSCADFQCPEDCPEPADHCTVTGQERGLPLYGRLRNIEIPKHRVHIIRSRQLAPGVGGYSAGDLSNMLKELDSHPVGKWVLGTACKCHGVVTAFRIEGIDKSRAEMRRRGESSQILR